MVVALAANTIVNLQEVLARKGVVEQRDNCDGAYANNKALGA
jgi:hypothetical protein